MVNSTYECVQNERTWTQSKRLGGQEVQKAPDKGKPPQSAGAEAAGG